MSIHEPIKRNSLVPLMRPHVKITAKQGKKIKVLQNNVAFFGQLYISMQIHERDLKFFANEIQQYPASLSDFGQLCLPNTKSNLLQCLELPDSDSPTMYDCMILDGAVVVHFLPTVRTVSEYADEDIVWDTYLPDCLRSLLEKKEESEFTGKGQGKPNSRLSG